MLKISMIFNSYILFSYLLRREEVVQLLLLLQSSWLSRDVVAVPVVAETDVEDSRAAAVGLVRPVLVRLGSSVPARE
jgi:hypothetical protein